MPKKLKLNQRIEIFLIQNQRTVYSYKEIADIFETVPRGVGSAMRAIGKRNFDVTNRVVYSSEK